VAHVPNYQERVLDGASVDNRSIRGLVWTALLEHRNSTLKFLAWVFKGTCSLGFRSKPVLYFMRQW